MTFSPQSLCVFCGSKLGNSPTYKTEAAKLGQTMAERKIRLVYGGGAIGIMGVVADEVLAHGGDVTGIIPQFLQDFEVGHTAVGELIITETMHERKREMFERASGFVILPGGLGTLEEAFEIMTWKQLRLHDKPIFILDCEGYWQPFVDLVERTIEGGFAHEKVRDLYQVVPDVEALFAAFTDIPAVSQEVFTSHL